MEVPPAHVKQHLLMFSLCHADFLTGLYHWGVDNYGDGSTPVVGGQIAAFQGHHQRPWTITQREFCNNLHKVIAPSSISSVLSGVWRHLLALRDVYNDNLPSQRHPANGRAEDFHPCYVIAGRKASHLHSSACMPGLVSLQPLMASSVLVQKLRLGVKHTSVGPCPPSTLTLA